MKKKKVIGVWTDDEILLLESLKGVSAKDAVSRFVGRTESSIKGRRSLLGIGRDGFGSRRKWEAHEIAHLKANPNKSYYQLAKELGRSQSAVAAKMKSGVSHKEWRCDICGGVLSQQGLYCKEHFRVGSKVRFYRSRMKLKFPDSTITDQQVATLVMGDCHYCGDKASGIDRVDSSKGYVEGNVVSCCAMCNIMKSDYTEVEWLSHLKKVICFTERAGA